jgi:hypothetical protein
MILSPNAKLLGIAMMLATSVSASAQYGEQRSQSPRDMVKTSRQSGGYCDQGGCPEHFWRYRIYYGPVFFHGTWFKGPVYVKDDNGRHYFWVRGGWRRDEWHAQRPSWARNGYFGPALPRQYYLTHNFGGNDQQRGDWRDSRDGQGYQDYQNQDGRGGGGHDDRPYRSGSKWQDPNSQNAANENQQLGEPQRRWRQAGDQSGMQSAPNMSDRYYQSNNQQRSGNFDRGQSNMQNQTNANGSYDRFRNGDQLQGGAGSWGQQPLNNRSNDQGRGGNGQSFASNSQPRTISVTGATYGASCKQPVGNVTKFLSDACNGKTTCDYVIKYQTIGDPAPGCSKDFSVQWTCSHGVGGTASVPAEAGLGSKITLQCVGNGR